MVQSLTRFVPLVRFADTTANASLSRTKNTACVVAPRVAPDTAFRFRRADSGPSGRVSFATANVRLLAAAPAAEKTSVVAEQVKSVPPAKAVPAMATCTVAFAAKDRLTGRETAAPPSSPTTFAAPKVTVGQPATATLTVCVATPALLLAVNVKVRVAPPSATGGT